MTLRPPAKDNQILDVVYDLLLSIGPGRDLYRGPVPQWVGRIYDIALLQAPLPALVIQAAPEVSKGLVSVEEHESWLHFYVHSFTENPESSDTDVRELGADVKRCLISGLSKALINRPGMGHTGEVIYLGSQPHIAIAPATGRAGLRQEFAAEYFWFHDAP